MEDPTKLGTSGNENKTEIKGNTTGGTPKGDFVAGTILASRYRIIGLVGKGGMGEVYKAEDIKLSQTVALKFLPDHYQNDSEALERFHGEVRNARQVSHVNVCRVFDIGEIDGRHFLSMEFVDGDDLSELLTRVGRFTHERAVEISRQLCVGMEAIHKAGILHRDFKPANIIIDKKGVARITDFGIAGIESEIAKDGIRAGTPAYMAPEQISGKEISTRSDIYALGLVIYEIFTGKQAFIADTFHEMLKKQQTETPTNPSQIVKGIDPLVESVIDQCLAKNPSDRPQSALHVAMALPGGNPMQIALDAGQTPSPEMVAASPKKGALKAPIAIALLAAVVAMFFFLVYFSYPFKRHRVMPTEKPPEVLLERAREITLDLGYTYTPADFAYAFDYDRAYGGYIRKYSKSEPPESWVNSPNRWERLRTGQPDDIHFWYRQSPRFFTRFGATEVDYYRPSATETAGMVRINLDMRGRLMEFTAVPPQADKAAEPSAALNWHLLFSQAGLDAGNFVPTEPEWTPWTYAEDRQAWQGPHVDHPEIPIRIEAATYRGKPVYFKVIMPWDEPFRDQEDTLFFTSGVRGAIAILAAVFVGLLICGLFTAWQNIRLGRADKKGAWKLFFWVFCLMFLTRVLGAHFNSSIASLVVLLDCIRFALSLALATWIVYIAIEPYVRKFWPELTISWSRLLAGDVKDPLVGRDVLVGVSLGLAHACWLYILQLLLFDANGFAEPIAATTVDPLFGFRGLAMIVTETLSASVFYTTMLFLLVVLVSAILKRRWQAAFAIWCVEVALVTRLFTFEWGYEALVAAAVVATILCVAKLRFGMLAFLSYLVVMRLSYFVPLTTDTSSWYFNVTVLSAVVIIGLAVYGFYTSLAGQPIFANRVGMEPETKKV